MSIVLILGGLSILITIVVGVGVLLAPDLSCPNCGKTHLSRGKACPDCGAKLPELPKHETGKLTRKPTPQPEREPTRIEQIRAAGIKKVKYLASGNGDDCAVCLALAEQVFDIDEAPSLPPVGCQCEPHCRSIVIAVK